MLRSGIVRNHASAAVMLSSADAFTIMSGPILTQIFAVAVATAGDVLLHRNAAGTRSSQRNTRGSAEPSVLVEMGRNE